MNRSLRHTQKALAAPKEYTIRGLSLRKIVPHYLPDEDADYLPVSQISWAMNDENDVLTRARFEYEGQQMEGCIFVDRDKRPPVYYVRPAQKFIDQGVPSVLFLLFNI